MTGSLPVAAMTISDDGPADRRIESGDRFEYDAFREVRYDASREGEISAFSAALTSELPTAPSVFSFGASAPPPNPTPKAPHWGPINPPNPGSSPPTVRVAPASSGANAAAR